MKYLSVHISAKRLFGFLIGMNVLFIILHLWTQYLVLTHSYSDNVLDMIERLNMDIEASIPTWFAQTLLFIAALLLSYITIVKVQHKDQYRYYWGVLAGVFLYLSIDEGSSIHELAIEPVQQSLNIDSGPLFFAWIIPASGLLVIFCLAYLRFWLSLPVLIRSLFAIAMVIFVSGAVGVEMISGSYWEAQNFDITYTFRALNAMEEGLENLGSSLFIYALLLYLSHIPKEKLLQFEFRR